MAAQLDQQVSGSEFSGSVGRTRPTVDVALAELDAAKLPIDVSLHELPRRHGQVRGPVAPGCLELEHHLTGGVGLHAFVGQRSQAMQTPEDVQAILKLGSLGWGAKRIARELGCNRNIVRRYLRQG